MKLTLLQHQEKFKIYQKDKMLLVWEGGTGKTVAGCVWLATGRDTHALVVCPSRVVKKWQKELEKWGTTATVLSFNEYKKLPIKNWSGIIIDEADELASPLFIQKLRSQITAKMYEQVRMYPNIPILALTATPVRSTAWNLHTLLCFIGVYVDWVYFRTLFFELKKMPYLPQKAWLPKKNWRSLVRPYLEKYADIINLRDIVDLPPATHTELDTPNTAKFINDEEWTPTASFVAEHKHEQQEKIKHILEIGKEYRKVLVVAYYREQLEQLEKELSKDKPTYRVDGSVKNQEELLLQANSSDVSDCYLLVQASLGAGFDADTFSCVVFTSMSYAVRDYVQMTFRVRRIHNLHPVQYYYLIGGRCDRAVHNNVQLGKDFVPSTWSDKHTLL